MAADVHWDEEDGEIESEEESESEDDDDSDEDSYRSSSEPRGVMNDGGEVSV